MRQAGGLAEDGATVDVVVALGATTVEEALAVSAGALLGTYAYAGVTAKETPAKVGTVTVLHDGDSRTAAGEDVARVASVLATAVATAREWVNVPANLLYPESFADEVETLAKGTKLRSRSWTRASWPRRATGA